jgi:hypothetical protein
VARVFIQDKVFLINSEGFNYEVVYESQRRFNKYMQGNETSIFGQIP